MRYPNDRRSMAAEMSVDGGTEERRVRRRKDQRPSQTTPPRRGSAMTVAHLAGYPQESEHSVARRSILSEKKESTWNVLRTEGGQAKSMAEYTPRICAKLSPMEMMAHLDDSFRR